MKFLTSKENRKKDTEKVHEHILHAKQRRQHIVNNFKKLN